MSPVTLRGDLLLVSRYFCGVSARILPGAIEKGTVRRECEPWRASRLAGGGRGPVQAKPFGKAMNCLVRDRQTGDCLD